MSKQLRIWLFALLGTLLTATTLLAEGVITMTTSKAVGETIELRIEANGNVTIEGAQETGQADSLGRKSYTIKSQAITIRGDMTTLWCYENQLTSLDVSGCSTLTMLDCSWNQLTSLDVSQNTALTTLWCYENQLTSLDVSKNTALTSLGCGSNELTSLDVSQNTALTMLSCISNELTSLDVSQNTALTELYCASNQLTSLDVSQNTALTTFFCPYNQLTSLDVSQNTALTSLSCWQNQLTSLNVSGCTALTMLFGSDNQLTSLNVSDCTALTMLSCSENQLTSLDVSNHIALTTLQCSKNLLRKIDLSGCTSIYFLTCDRNQIKAPEMANLVNSLPDLQGKGEGLFKVFYDGSGEENVCLATHVATAKAKSWKTQFTRDFGGLIWYDYTGADNPVLAEGVITMTTSMAVGEEISLVIEANGNVTIEGAQETGREDSYGGKLYRLSSQTVTIRGDVTTLECYGNELTSLDVSQNTSLTTLNCSGNNYLTSLDVSQNTSLTKLYCSMNQLTSLDVSQNTALTKLSCVYNQLTSLDVSQNTALAWLDCSRNQLTSLDVSQNTSLTKLHCFSNQLTSLNVSGCTALTTLYCSSNQLTSLNVSQNTSLTTLNCSGNNYLTSLDASGCSALTTLNCYGNQLTRLDVSQNSALTTLDCFWNQLTSLDVSKNTALTTLNCYGNQLTRLDVSQNSALTKLNCRGNQIKGEEMTRLVNSLPDRTGKSPGIFTVVQEPTLEGNICLKSDVAIAKGKNWDALKYKSNTQTHVAYEGEEPIPYAVTLTKEGEGTLTATGAADLTAVPYGTELTVEAAPAEGYELTALTANGKDILATKKLSVKEDTEIKATFTQKTRTYTVTFSKTGEGRVTATGADDLDAVPSGTELTIEATPATGYELTALTANGRDILSTRRFVVKGDTEVKATFTQKASNYTVTFSKIGEGRVTATGADDLNAVPYGTELTVVATPAAGYELTALTANGRDILSTRRFVVKGDTEVKATFTEKASNYTVTFSKTGEGRVTATGADDLDAVPSGTELTIEATPATGYELTALTANGRDILSTRRFVVKGDTEVKATFTQKASNYTVTFSKIGEGRVTATGADDLNAVPYGTDLTVVATPAAGYELTALTANDKDILATKSFVVKSDTEVKATFTKQHFAVTLTQEAEGLLVAKGYDNLSAVPYGTELTISAQPKMGYELVTLTANNEDILATRKVVITENTTIKATFAKKTFAVTLDKEGEGVLDATGADDLKAVPYGTKLTIIATPAEGYELKALLANGFDIRSTKSVEVTGDTRIKAIFKQQTFAVTLPSCEHGKVEIAEPVDLKAVPYGTTLTISATPETGYELTALTANGEEILATKSFVVKGATEIRATFSMAHFAVTLTHDGEGKVDVAGADNLKAVPYGTELTIVATPKQGYELTALTANDKDILATRKVVVTEDLTIKATFAKETFVVTLDKEGEGVLDATGADDLKAVPYGTKLTIIATPAEGYELKALLANGFDIRSTKSVEVTGDTRIKAIFKQQTFAVTLTSNEHGKIEIAEPVDLKAVPYGTKLTVKATGKNAQCELTALTANGEDILATQSFVVKGETEVKATFVDHTGVETTVTQQVKLYPNPATDYVFVEGVAPASEVTLHSMTGERLYAGRADSRGVLQIDLTPYADGVYLVCVADETYRIVVRR